MEKTMKIVIACMAVLAALVIAQTAKFSLTEVQDCTTNSWQTEEPIWGTCQKAFTTTICDDEPTNKSCHDGTAYYPVACVTGTQIMQHSEDVCTPKAIQITQKSGDVTVEQGSIEFKEWGKCSYANDKSVIICDSRYDGNNDGICTSGESCVKFELTSSGIKRLLKNSEDSFKEDDPSFFLDKLDYEVTSQ